MAKQAPAKGNDGWKGYVNWSPTAADREQVVGYMGRKHWNASNEIQELIQSGYSVSFSSDKNGGALRVAVTGKEKSCPNVGYTLSIRASTVDRCMGLVGYYCNTICIGQDWLVDKVGEDVW